MKKTQTTNVKRRSFLKGAALSTVAVTSGAIADNAVAEDVPDTQTKSRQGYKLTSHIKEYYRLARF